jgi:F-type H+-transporting ATPase subunit delta
LSIQAIARRYSTALADVTLPRGEAREVQQEIDQWCQMMQSNDRLHEIFRNPTIPYNQKRSLLGTLIERTRVRPTTANFLMVLLQNQRLSELSEVSKRFAQVLDERSGVVSAHVTTARPVPESVRLSLRSTLVSLTGKDVRLSYAIDPDLIGGIVTRIGSTVYDGSVRNQLDLLRGKMAGENQ